MKLLMKRLVLSAIACCLVLAVAGQAGYSSVSAAPVSDDALMAPSRDHRKISKDIVEHLKHRHYLKISLDDQLSSKVLYRFLDELDPGHSYFYASDVKEFESKYRYKLDNAFKKGDLSPGFEIFNRYQQRVVERLTEIIARIEQGIDDINFDVEETFRVDRKDIPWPGSEVAMKELWRKRLKNNILSLKLADKPMDEIREVLLKRYRNQLNRIKQNTSDDAFEFYINSLALSIDPHTQYFSPHRTENFNINMSLSLEGIGAVLQTEDEYTKVLRLIAGGPAERSGLLKAADRIVGVAQGSDGKMLDIVGWRLDEVVNKIRGPKGTLVRLEIIPADAVDDHQTKVIRIVRDKVKLEEQAAKKEIIEVRRGLKTHKIGIIDVPTFYADFKGMHAGSRNYKSTTKDVRRLIGELQDEDVVGIIIDLRDNGGGSLQEANSLSGLFIGLGPTVQVKNANGDVDVIRDYDPKLVYSGPVVVLVNRMSASASEIFAGAIQDYERGIVLGEQTFGKGTVQSLLPLAKGQLKATTAKYYRVSGKSTQNKGVIPDLDYPSLHSFEEVGESSLDEAMEWDRISSIPYQTYYNLGSLRKSLENRHLSRTRMSLDYQYLLDRRAKNDEMRRKKTVSLSEKTRMRELEEADQWRLDLENKLRHSKGEPPLEKLTDLSGDEPALAHSPPSEIDLEDPFMVEAGEVVLDFIDLLKNLANR